jgi:alkanesulfonate monooxygenase SsuD/methylene tetrahydromethanopterin reductase-like flavin-dependent oxidoreductase (luciferase family)
MHTGLSLIFQNLAEVDDRDVYSAELDLAVRAKEAGFDSVWVPRHHFTNDDRIEKELADYRERHAELHGEAPLKPFLGIFAVHDVARANYDLFAAEVMLALKNKNVDGDFGVLDDSPEGLRPAAAHV